MRVRCRKCLKKYDDCEVECPRCGAINDRDYSKQSLYQEIRVEGKKSNLTVAQFKRYQCGFCGELALFEGLDCLHCGSSNIIGKTDETHMDGEAFDELIDKLFESDGLVDLSSIRLLESEKDHPIHQWELPYNSKYGSLYDKISVLLLGGTALFIAILMLGSGNGTTILILLILLGIPSGVSLTYMTNYLYSDEIRFSGGLSNQSLKIIWHSRAENARYRSSLYEAKIDDINYIEIDLDEKINGLRFVAKANVNMTSRDFYIDTRAYDNDDAFKRMIVLLALRKDFRLSIKRKGIKLEKKESLETYIRQDKFLREPSQLEYKEHQMWIAVFKDRYECEFGYLEDDSLLMIFKMTKSEKNAGVINKDPFITEGVVDTNIMKWTKELSN
jgi:uncharacterized membrane protein/phage FluMu protein Com